MFKGQGTACLGIAPFIGIKMASYDFLMDRFGCVDNNNPQQKYYNLSMGAMAGIVAVTFTYPLDLIKKLIQLNGSPDHNYTGFLDACQQRYKSDGVPGFFKGLLATYYRIVPLTATLFLTNEAIKSHFNI